MNPSNFRRILLVIWSIWPAAFACAHPISLSSAVINVQRDKVDVELEIMLEDLVLYHRLTADAQMLYRPEDLRKVADAHRSLLLEWFTILDGDGQRLKGESKSLDTKEIESAGIGQTELMRRTVRYEFTYPLESAPNFLTFVQKMGGETSVLPAVMDLHILKDGSIGDKPAQILFGRPHTTQFDWSTTNSGKRRSMAELRAQREQQKQQRLGIASYTGLYSFLYITRFEVRHELLIPLVTLEQWLTIPRRDPNFLEVAEQEQAKTLIEDFFKKKSYVSINGQKVEARLSRMNVFGLDIADFALNAAPRRINIAQARIGVILSFPVPKLEANGSAPREVEVKWSTYSEHAPFIHSIVMVGDEKPIVHDFQSLDETFQWKGELPPPSLKPVSIPAASTKPEEMKQSFESLLRNVYSAFEYREDSDVYDALETSVDGALLKELYLNVKRSLVIAEQGGALSRATKIEVLDVKPAGSNNKSFEITWKLAAETEHWGHLHLRSSQYRARVTMTSEQKTWKLAKLQILEEQRLAFETSLRGYDSNP